MCVGKEGGRTEVDKRRRLLKGSHVYLSVDNNIIYFDSFFTGVELEQSLLADGIYSCGTIRSNRRTFPMT